MKFFNKSNLAEWVTNREFVAFIGLLVLIIIFSIATPDFLSTYNIMNTFRQASIIAVLAVGMTYVIISGGIDLSVGSIVSLSGTIAAYTMIATGSGALVGIVVGLGVGILAGLINGIVVSILKVPPIIATLAMLTVAQGVPLAITGGYPVSGLPDSFDWIGRASIGPIPTPVIIMFFVYLVGYIILKYSKFGAYIYGIGGNEEATRLSGLRVTRVKIWIYVFSGITASIGGLILASRMSSGQPLAGQGLELDAIAAVVIGGASIMGGSGGVIGSLIGALIMAVLSNGLDLMNINSYYQMIFTGIIIVVAVASQRNKREGR